MPQPVKHPGPSNIYREQLSSLYHGIALWKPSPVEDIYNQVSIGDVGYISSKGNFIRMFNVTLPWDDPSNRRLAQPEPYDHITIASIARENFGQVDYYSRHVSREENASNTQVATHEQARGVTYTCRGLGALLSLPCGGYREDAVHERLFRECIRNNVDSWSNWSRNVGLPVDRMDDLIFITGCTLVTSYASAVLDGRIADAEISLVSSLLNNGGASFVWSNIRGTIEHHDSQLNPNVPSAPRNRCVFIRGFRAKRVLFWNKPIRAAAEPHLDDPDDPDDPDDNGMEDIQVNEVPYVPKYIDPLNGVLDYIVEICLETADAEGALAIAHDDDLQIIKSIETLTADAVPKFLHENKIPVLIENGVATLQGDNITRNQSRGDQVPQVQDSQLEATLLGIDEEKREYARRLFQCLAVSISPPRIEELAEIIAFQFPKATPSASWRPENAEEAVLSACPSFISIVDSEGHRVVQFSHLSIKEYLTSERLRTAEERLSYFHILLEPAHTILAHPRMSYLAPSTSSFQSTERISQGAVSGESQQQSPHTASIHILDVCSLLNLFFHCRPFLLNEDQDVNTRFRGGMPWVGERWWYRLAHVCRRWRNLILGSPIYLGLCLVCTYNTPIADMLVHSPLLPLVIDYEGTDITAEDEEEIALALVQRDRVQRIRFNLPVLQLQKLVMAIDGEYPILEYLILVDPFEDKSTVLKLPETLQIPHLRHLSINCSIPIRFRLLTTPMGLVTLHLALHHPSIYFQPTVLLQWLSWMPQLEVLLIYFCFVVPDREVESELVPRRIVTPITLPNLRLFAFHVISAYSEAVLSRITAPRLENLQISYPQQLRFFVPELLQFMGRTEKFEFYRANFNFSGEKVCVQVNGPETNMTIRSFSINVNCWHLDWQVSSVADIFDTPSQISSSVKHLTLARQVHSRSSEEHNDNEAELIDWRRLLMSFSNVKTLHIGDGLVRELSRCLPLEDGEQPLVFLPELQELTYSASSNVDDAFAPFIDARQNAGRPITLIKRTEMDSKKKYSDQIVNKGH